MTDTTTTPLEPFTRLFSNVKGTMDVPLGKFTAFVGENRTGKTARIDAIRLALTGKHPAGPHGSDLMELAPEGAGTLFAELDGPSGRSVFRVETEGGKAKKPNPPERDGLLRGLTEKELEHILPAQSMASILSLGSALGREAIFKRFGNIDKVPTPRGLSEAQLTLWQQGVREVRERNAEADSAQVLSETAAWMRSKKTSLGREIKTLDKLIKEREAALAATTVGAEQLDALKAQLAQAQAWERASGARARKVEVDAQAQAYRERVLPIIEAEKTRAVEAAQFAEEQAAVRAEVEDIESRIRGHLQVVKEDEFKLHGGEYVLYCEDIALQNVDDTGMAACLFCGNPHDPAALIAAVKPRVDARRAALAEALQAVDKLREEQTSIREGLTQRERDWQAQHAAREAEKAQFRVEHARIDAQQKEIAVSLGDTASYEGLTSSELMLRIHQLETASIANKQLDQDVARLRRLETEQQMAKTLEGEGTKELTHLLARTSETAHAAVNKYMPDGFRAEVDLETAKWQVIGRDGRPHKRAVMAGSEKGALTTALALGWTDGAPGRFLILEDEDLASFSPTNLRRLFDTLKDALDDGLLTQVFIAWSRRAEIPEYAHAIFTDTGEQTSPVQVLAPAAPAIDMSTLAPAPSREAPQVLL